MSLRTHLTVCLSVIILTIIAREFIRELPCPDSLARYCFLGQKLTDVFLIIYSSGLIVTLTVYFFIGFSRAWSYLKTYLFAIATYIISIPIYFFLFTFLIPIMFKMSVTVGN